MSECYIHCLLFVAHKGPIPTAPPSSPLSFKHRSQLVVYAILPFNEELDYAYDIFTMIGITVLHDEQLDPSLVQAIKSDRVEMIEIFIDKHLVQMEEYLRVLTQNTNQDIVKEILKGFVIGTFYDYPSDYDYVLADENTCAVMKRVVSDGADIRYRNTNGGTVLNFAIQNQDEWLVELLLDSGASVHGKVEIGLTPMHVAAKYLAPVSILELLLQHGADVNAPVSSNEPYLNGASPLQLAVFRSGYHYNSGLNVIECLLDNGALINGDSSLENVLRLALDKESKVFACVLSHVPDLKTPSIEEMFRFALQNPKTVSIRTNIKLMADHGLRLRPEDAKNVLFLVGAIEVDSPDLIKDLFKWGAGVYHSKEFVKKTLIYEIERCGCMNIITRYDSIDLFLELEDSFLSELYQSVLKRAIRSVNIPTVADILSHGGLFTCLIFNEKFFKMLDKVLNRQPERFGRHTDSVIERHIMLKNTIIRHVIALILVSYQGSPELFQEFQKRIKGMVQDRINSQWCVECLKALLSDEYARDGAAVSSELIGESSLSFAEFLNSSDHEIIRYLNEEKIVEALKVETYENFQLYSGMISKRFHKAYNRKKQMKEGIRMLNFVSKEFRNLPLELKEIIVEYLSYKDLLVLTNVCNLPAEIEPIVS